MKRFATIISCMLTILVVQSCSSAVAWASDGVDVEVAFPSSNATASRLTEEASGESTLQEWFDANNYSINVVEDELGIETFSAGSYQTGILAEIAGYASSNNLSWYTASSDDLHMIFVGANSSGDLTTFTACGPFGLCLGSPDGLFCTETSRNPDGFDHALVFSDPSRVGGYIVAWEDMWAGGDMDFQDMILATLKPIIEARVCIFPRALNLRSCGKWLTCIIRVPLSDCSGRINASSIVLNRTIPAEPRLLAAFALRRFGARIVVVKFSRAAVIELIKGSLGLGGRNFRGSKVALEVSGRFAHGQSFVGHDGIWVLSFPRSFGSYPFAS